MNKDWTGNKKSTYTTLGSSNHSDHDREENDYYATQPDTIDDLFKVEEFEGNIWENACGGGHLSKQMEKLGKSVFSTDLIDRGYGISGIDFLNNNIEWNGNIVTNPPYSLAQEFCEEGLKKLKDGKKMAMFLKLTFLEGQKRRKFFDKFPPQTVYVFSQRRKCAMNGEFEKTGSSAACYAWFVWTKGVNTFPVLKWI